MLKIGNLNTDSKESAHYNTIRQAQDFLNDNYRIRINKYKPGIKRVESLSKKYEFSVGFDEISLHLAENDIKIGDTTLRKILNSPNYIKHYDPIEEYFNSLDGKWNGVSHIEKLCTLITARDFEDKEEGYYQIRLIRYFKKWLVAAVACSLQKEPNQVAMGFIQEEEGTGKTSIVKMLTPGSLKEMQQFSDKDKKVFGLRRAFTENFMVIFDEMEGLTPHTAETFKTTMTADIIDIKEPNDPFPRRKPRVANAVFTTNNVTGRNRGFLYPAMGTRRFLCFHIESIDYDRIMDEIDIDQLWAEALMLYKGNHQYLFTPEDFKEFKEYNTRYFIETSALQIIQNNYTHPLNGKDGEWMQPIELMRDIKKRRLAAREQLLDITPEKIGVALKQLGYIKQPRRVHGQPRYAYLIKTI